MNRLSQRVAVVTGAANGIGRGCALRLAKKGASVALVDIEAGALDDARAEIERSGGVCAVYVVDCLDRAAVPVFRTTAEAVRATGAVALIAGSVAREGVTMRHAGALIHEDVGTVASKSAALGAVGAHVFTNIGNLVAALSAEAE